METENTNSKIKVSIIVPVYNVEQYLREGLDSLCAQTLKDIEIICVDDGSSDSSLEILKEYEKRDPRIRVFSQANAGPAAARNVGIDNARGNFIAFFDPDDLAEKEMYEVLFNEAQKCNADVVECSGTVFDGGEADPARLQSEQRSFDGLSDVPAMELTPETALCGSTGGHAHAVPWNKIYRREFLNRHNLRFDPILRKMDDAAFRYSVIPRCKVYRRITKKLYRYRVGRPNAITSQISDKDKNQFLLFTKSVYENWKNANFFENPRVKSLFFWRLYGVAKWRVKLILGENASDDEMFNFLKDFFQVFPGITAYAIFEDNSKIPLPTRDKTKIRDFILSNNATTLPSNVKPKISIIVPVYNVEEYLPESLNSICEQTLREIEIICINDGSTDNSLSILKARQHLDPRIVIISRENKGVGYSRNEGMAIAQGEFIAFMDPDDYYPSKTTLEDLYIRATKNNANVCGGNFVVFNVATKTEKIRNFDKDFFEKEGFLAYKDYQFDYCYQRYIFKTEFLKSNNIVFPNYRRFQDPPFLIKALALAENFYAIPQPAYVYRWSHKNINWTEEKVYHLLLGLRDCFELTLKYDLKKAYSKLVGRIRKEYRKTILSQSSERIENAKKEIINICISQDTKFNSRIFENLRGAKRSFCIPAIFVRIAALFILNKQARKHFRERHMDLTPKDGIDYNTLSPKRRREIKRKKRENSHWRKLFNAFVPATRAKIQHSERHILEEISRQNALLRAEIRKLQDKINKK